MKQFWAGVLAQIGISSLIQDIVGKEEYLRHVEANWISAAITIPLAVMVLGIAFILATDE